MKTFEDLPVYQKSKELCISIYKFENAKFQRDFGFKDQIQRASISVLNNIAEGFERGSDKDFIKFLYYSKGSVDEIRSLLNIAIELNYVDKPTFDKLRSNCIDISQQLSNFIKYLSEKS